MPARDHVCLNAMTANTTSTNELNHSAADVHAAIADRGFWDYLAENLIAGSPAEVNSFSSSEAKTDVSVTQHVDSKRIPDAMKKFVKSDPHATIDFNWGPFDGQESTGNFSGSVQGFPVSFRGNQTLVAIDDAKSKVVTDITLDVKIPLVGGMVEGKAVDMMPRMFTKIINLLDQYLADNKNA